MTSKEALHYIKAGARYVGKVNNELKQLPLWEHEIKTIEKDLEVLDILKKLFALEYEPKKVIISGTLTPEEFDKIKEWLNEK